MASAVQGLTTVSGSSHQVIAQQLWAAHTHSSNKPTLHHNRSLGHFDHITAIVPTICFCSLLNNASVSHDITWFNHPSASLLVRHHYQPHSNIGHHLAAFGLPFHRLLVVISGQGRLPPTESATSPMTRLRLPIMRTRWRRLSPTESSSCMVLLLSGLLLYDASRVTAWKRSWNWHRVCWRRDSLVKFFMYTACE